MEGRSSKKTPEQVEAKIEIISKAYKEIAWEKAVRDDGFLYSIPLKESEAPARYAEILKTAAAKEVFVFIKTTSVPGCNRIGIKFDAYFEQLAKRVVNFLNEVHTPAGQNWKVFYNPAGNIRIGYSFSKYENYEKPLEEFESIEAKFDSLFFTFDKQIFGDDLKQFYAAFGKDTNEKQVFVYKLNNIRLFDLLDGLATKYTVKMKPLLP